MKRIKRGYIIVLLGYIICTVQLSHSQVKVDGNLSDWKEEHFVFDKENTLYYAIQHDKENIYIAIRKDEYTGKISSSTSIGGIQLYLDKTGKRDTTVALNIGYPVSSGSVDIDWDILRLNRVDTIKHATTISVYNDYGIFITPQYEMKDYDLEKYQVEYKIPLEYIRPESDKKISICILLKGMRWKAPEKARTGGLPDFSTIQDVELRNRIVDMFDWSYSWIDYIVK